MAAARAAIRAAPTDGMPVIEGFLRTEGLLREAATAGGARRAALEESARRWYRFGRIPPRLAADLAAEGRDAVAWGGFAAEVRLLGVSVAAVRALACRAFTESDALRLFLVTEGLGVLRDGHLGLDGERFAQDGVTARRGLQRLGYRFDQALALAAVGDWAASRLAQFEVASASLLSTLAAIRGRCGAAVHARSGQIGSVCDQIADLMARATCAALDQAAEEPPDLSGWGAGVGHFPYRERLTSLGRRLAAMQEPALFHGGCHPHPRAAVETFSEALGALRDALLGLPQRLDDYANGFENLGAEADRVALGLHAAGIAPRIAPACAHLARIQASHLALASIVGLAAARQDAVADARERLLAFACTRADRSPRAPVPEHVAAVDLFYTSVTRGLAHVVADLDQRQAELAAAAQAFRDLLAQAR
jgi:hypothetical protein